MPVDKCINVCVINQGLLLIKIYFRITVQDSLRSPHNLAFKGLSKQYEKRMPLVLN